MVQYQATPDYYNDYIAHYGVKGMKWKKRLKGKYYKTKSKLDEKVAKTARFINLIHRPELVSGEHGLGVGNAYLNYSLNRKDSGKANHLSGQTGSRKVTTTKVRTGITKVENRPIARKKKIVSGTKTPRKRK